VSQWESSIARLDLRPVRQVIRKYRTVTRCDNIPRMPVSRSDILILPVSIRWKITTSKPAIRLQSQRKGRIDSPSRCHMDRETMPSSTQNRETNRKMPPNRETSPNRETILSPRYVYNHATLSLQYVVLVECRYTKGKETVVIFSHDVCSFSTSGR
jgi:hypothetical protein